ncbi:MAG: hypothetical protein A2Z16_01590 [Chloroflexi bacterium RBG_16_54_18]|nr:MAG: hypothetical protein A2Z16_01590 [Chloroflexi bacterium RBG_16_54_18]
MQKLYGFSPFLLFPYLLGPLCKDSFQWLDLDREFTVKGGMADPELLCKPYRFWRHRPHRFKKTCEVYAGQDF